MLIWDRLGMHGRLGNSLYQLAATIGLGQLLGEEVRFNADWIHRPYFSVPDVLYGDAAGARPVAEAYAPMLDNSPTSGWRLAYLQDFALIEPVLPLVREYLQPSDLARSILDECTEFAALPQPVLSVHVRRGDNVPGADPFPEKYRYWPLPPLSYYEAAIAHLESGTASIAVFSDDTDGWCRENLPAADYHHVGIARPKEHQPDYFTAPVLDWIDLQLQARCSKHVLSNSTFGWWAALLAGDDDAIVPWPVVGPALAEVDMNLAIPSSWRRLAYEETAAC